MFTLIGNYENMTKLTACPFLEMQVFRKARGATGWVVFYLFAFGEGWEGGGRTHP